LARALAGGQIPKREIPMPINDRFGVEWPLIQEN